MTSARRCTYRLQLLERREELLYNKLLLLEHELRKYRLDIAKKVCELTDPDSIREIVKMVDVELSREEDIRRYQKVSKPEKAISEDSEPVLDDHARIIDRESEIVEEYYLGQRVLERLLISSW
ncbi:MAG: hypothetical protein GXO23_03255 [Crenarchaeota archaeon]|nr:hypothetical protein [Thermoproteota archaeon]